MSKPIKLKSRKAACTVQPSNCHVVLAAKLDRAADHHLHLGYHLQAERLARLAADLRETAR